MGKSMNPTSLKLRILRLKMNRKNLLKLNIKISVKEWKSIVRGDRMMFVCVLCLSNYHCFKEKKKKMFLEILPKYCNDSIVMSLWFVGMNSKIVLPYTAQKPYFPSPGITWKVQK